MPLHRRHLLTLAAASVAQPAFAQGSAVTEFRWIDASRKRELPVRLRLPSGVSHPPLVLFSHGLGGNLDAGADWSEAWARAGLATLHLQHHGSDTEVLREDGPRGLRKAADWEQLIARAEDVRFVLDELQRRRAELPALNLDAIGMSGHSFGAHTTLAVAGQAFPLHRGRLDDPRPRAFAAFSPSPGHSRDAAFRGITRPMLCLSGTLDGDPLGFGRDKAHDGSFRREVYAALPKGDKAELWLDAADHMSFGGQTLSERAARHLPRRLERQPQTVAQAERHRALIAAVTTDWWRAHLLGDAAARERLRRGPVELGPKDEWNRA